MIIASHLFKIICVAGTILSTLYKLLTIVLSGFCIPILEMDMLRSREQPLFAQSHPASYSLLQQAPEHTLLIILLHWKWLHSLKASGL